MNTISKTKRDQRNSDRRMARRDEKISRTYASLRDGFVAQGMELGEACRKAIEEMTKGLR